MYLFKSSMNIGQSFLDEIIPDNDIKNEPMFFSSSFEYAYKNGGEITKSFLEKFAKHYNFSQGHAIFDSRSHMLMKGWYPCIPGFHHDDVERETRADKQPNYENPIYRAQHCMGLVNGHICPTQFALGSQFFSYPKPGQIAYKIWHDEVERYIKKGQLDSANAPSNRLIFFDDRSWHQGTRAVFDGWRWFGRISWSTNRKIKNEIRKQVQVYLENPTEGW